MRAKDFITEKEKTLIDAIRDFLPLAIEYLELKQLPKIDFKKNVLSKHDQTTFGVYHHDNDTKLIELDIEERHPIDIIRTLAHELVHFKQDMQGRLGPNSWKTGSPTENEAHDKAGIMMRIFDKKYPKYLKMQAVQFNESIYNLVETQFAINRNPVKGTWQLRIPKPGAPLVDETSHIILKNAKPWKVPEGSEKLSITSFIIGEETKENPSGEGRQIGYIKSLGENPFVYMDTMEPYTGSKYAEFNNKKFIAYDDNLPEATIDADDLIDIYIKGTHKGKTLTKLVASEFPNSRLPLLIKKLEQKYNINPNAIVYGPTKQVSENFADGKIKGKSRPGRVKRAGASCAGSVTDLRKRAKNASGEKAKMYHWCANMKSGRNK